MKIEEDKLAHFLACAFVAVLISTVMAALGADFFPCYVAGFLGGTACGIGKEYGDSKAQGNCWSWGDIVADVVGALAGSLAGLLALLN